MVNGVPCRSMCGHLCQLEVCKLLHCGDQVVYPKGLNVGLELVQILLSRSLIWGMDILGKPTHKPSFLLVDLSWVTLGDHTPKVPAACRTLTPPSFPHSAMKYPSSTATCPSMAARPHTLLSQAMLDTSSPASGGIPPRRPTSVVLSNTLTRRSEDHPGQGASFSHTQAIGYLPTGITVSRHAWWHCAKQPFVPHTLVLETPEAANIPTIPTSKTSTGDDSGVLLDVYKGRSTWPWDGCLWPGHPWMLPAGSRFQVPRLPSVRMKLKLLKPFRKWRPGAWPWFGKLRSHVLPLSGRQRPPVQITPAPCNKLIGTVWRA